MEMKELGKKFLLLVKEDVMLLMLKYIGDFLKIFQEIHIFYIVHYIVILIKIL